MGRDEVTALFCPECGAPAQGRFCGECGTSLPYGPEVVSDAASTPEYEVGASGESTDSVTPVTAPVYRGVDVGRAGDGRRRAGWVLAGAAVLVLAGGGFAAWRGLSGDTSPTEPVASAGQARAASSPALKGSSTSAPATSAPATSAPATSAGVDERQRRAAAAIDALLSRSADQRAKVQRATATCKVDPLGSARDLQDVIEGRRALLAQAHDAPFSEVSRGDEMKVTLQQAWTHSLNADERFLDWVRNDTSCSEQSASYRAGFEASRSAQAAKKEFVQVWEVAVRQPQGLPTVRTTANI